MARKYPLDFSQCNARFMGMANSAVAASQVTAFMAIGNPVIAITNYWQGVVADRLYCSTALYIDAMLVLIPPAIDPLSRNREEMPRNTPSR